MAVFNDTVNSNTIEDSVGDDILIGGNERDHLEGYQGDDILLGLSESDTLKGGEGDDVLSGGPGDDVLEGGEGDDRLHGDSGDDVLYGNGGMDILKGGTGSDTFVYRNAEGANGDIIKDFTPGSDKIDFSALGSSLGGSLVFSEDGPKPNAVWVVKEGNNLRLVGDASGTPENPAINILLKNVTSLSAADVGMTITLRDGVLDATDQAIPVTLDLSTRPDMTTAVGGPRSDTFIGNSRDNHFEGGAGSDLFKGGAGNNTFVYRSAEDGRGDIIENFTPGRDKIDFSVLGGDLIFSENGPQPNAVWTIREGEDLRLIGDTSGTLRNIPINILLKNVTSLSAADVGMTTTLRDGALDASGQTDSVTLDLNPRSDLWGATGGSGNDFFIGSNGENYFDGGEGVDTADYSRVSSFLGINLEDKGSALVNIGGRPSGALLNIENVFGGYGGNSIRGNNENNLLRGGAGKDTLYGNGGNDTFIGSGESDQMDGGDGVDTVDYSARFESIELALGDEIYEDFLVNGEKEDRVKGIENVTGGLGNDVFTGNGSANHLEGGFGDDIISGGLGDDVLYGNDGADLLEGGAGGDTFAYRSVESTNGDTIKDFTPGSDKIDFSALGSSLGGSLLFSEEGPQSNTVWTIKDGEDLRLVGDVSGTPENPAINILLKNVTSLSAADVGMLAALQGDTLNASDQTESVTLDLNFRPGLRNAIGSSGNDVFIGNNEGNRFEGGAGRDVFTGGAGNDTFIYKSVEDGRGDTIKDFTQGSDKIDISHIPVAWGGFFFTGEDPTNDGAVWYTTLANSNGVVVDLTTDSHMGRDFNLTVLGVTSLVESDFVF